MLAATSGRIGLQAAYRGVRTDDESSTSVAAETRRTARSETVDQPHQQSHDGLLRIPPFPGSRAALLAKPAAEPTFFEDAYLDEIADALRSYKVGGSYWGPKPALPETSYTLVRIGDPGLRRKFLMSLSDEAPALCWLGDNARQPSRDGKFFTVRGPCDPWHLLGGASAVLADASDELAVLAAAAGIPVSAPAPEGGGVQKMPAEALRELVRQAIGAFEYVNPFTGEPMEPLEAIELCGFWRSLIDSNRDLSAAIGFAFWKRATVAPLLWSGSKPVPFRSQLGSIQQGSKVAVWKARTSQSLLAELEEREAHLVEVEDGFIRSAGLGADCVPPLSVVVDRVGVHFDPNQPSELEQILENGSFSDELIERARQLRQVIVASGLSKYERGGLPNRQRPAGRHYILVPGQVEDDRAVVVGGQGLSSNFELLRRVRADSPDAYIIYKPHPDVEAGHRSGSLLDQQSLTVADEVVRGEPMSALLDSVDEVHINTSLAGFEALLREKAVTTHGVPFYAGWGLTRDLGPVPARRTARRSLDELVAATLLLYPRYLDPLTGLPCPPEILVRRLSETRSPVPDGLVVRLRRFQGRFKRGLAAIRALVVK